MPITNALNIPVTSPSQSHFFSEKNEQTNKVKPLYLFCEEDDKSNALFFFITDSDDHCWIKKDKIWNESKINSVLLARDGGSRPSKTYFLEDTTISCLEISYRQTAYYKLMDKSEILLKNIPLSCEELTFQSIPNLESFDLTDIPKTKKEVEKKIALNKEKQENVKEIQKIESIISSLGRAKETMKKLSAPNQESIDLLTNLIKDHEEKLSGLHEKRDLLNKGQDAMNASFVKEAKEVAVLRRMNI